MGCVWLSWSIIARVGHGKLHRDEAFCRSAPWMLARCLAWISFLLPVILCRHWPETNGSPGQNRLTRDTLAKWIMAHTEIHWQIQDILVMNSFATGWNRFYDWSGLHYLQSHLLPRRYLELSRSLNITTVALHPDLRYQFSRDPEGELNTFIMTQRMSSCNRSAR